MNAKNSSASTNPQSNTLNQQFPNVYHLLPNNSFYQMPIDMDCRVLHPYQSPVFNMRESFVTPNFNDSLMNRRIYRFTPPLPSVSQLPPQWPGPLTGPVENMNDIPREQFNDSSNYDKDSNKQRKKKFKKRSIQEQLQKKEWKKEDADLALKVEYEYGSVKKRQQIIIKFPDEELSAEAVKKFHSSIKFVHFQTACGPRYCFAQIGEDEDVDAVIAELNVTEFQNGFLKAERKIQKEEEELSPEEIDPYTLYLGNLPQSITSSTVKEKFKKASRIDIGFAQKIKFTRYAFIRFKNVQDAVEAYKENVDIVIDNRSVILRFRRLNTATQAHKDTEATKKKIKLEETASELENNEPPVPGEILETEPLCGDIVEIKTEPNRGYSGKNNATASNPQPMFGTLFAEKNRNIVQEMVQCLQNIKNVNVNGIPPPVQHSSGESIEKPGSSPSPLVEFVSQLTGIPCVSSDDAELFRSVIFKLSDILKNTNTFSVEKDKN